MRVVEHSAFLFVRDCMNDVLQGVTFEVLSEISLSPVNESTAGFWLEMFLEANLEITWRTLGEYLQTVEASGVSPNFGTFVSAATVRMNIIGMDKVDPIPNNWMPSAG